MTTISLYHEQYNSLLHNILHIGIVSCNQRTNHYTMTLPHPTSFTIALDDYHLPLVSNRKTNPLITAAEVCWWLLGTTNPQWLEKYTKVWTTFKEQDGTIPSSYGYRWQYAFGRNQLQLVINTLKKDLSNRQCYIASWDPRIDGLGTTEQKSIPCPVGFILNIVGGKLNTTLILRSSDVFLGLPYDVMWIALLAHLIAYEIDIDIGYLHVSIANAHVYQAHWALARQSLSEIPQKLVKFPIHLDSIANIQQNPDKYVETYKKSIQMTDFHTFSPKIPLIC